MSLDADLRSTVTGTKRAEQQEPRVWGARGQGPTRGREGVSSAVLISVRADVRAIVRS
jgi:hypothetical protein